MRPRSRLLAKKRLPTIREGHEELLQDMNQANSCHARSEALSSEAYLQSICQLARPAFPLREPDCDILALGSLDSVRLASRPPLSSAQTPARPPTPSPTLHGYRNTHLGNRGAPQVLSSTTMSNGVHQGTPDPLEYLYGHRGSSIDHSSLLRDAQGQFPLPPREGGATESRCLARANSFPGHRSPRHTLRKNSCSELSLQDMASSTFSPAGPCPPAESRPHAGPPPLLCLPSQVGGSTEKHSMVSHWISDCRSAWRETRVRSCMLPAIAEM